MDAASLPFVEDDEEGDVCGGDHDGANHGDIHGANDLDDEVSWQMKATLTKDMNARVDDGDLN